MEEVTNNLLRFARPVPLKFKYSDINEIIESSILFVQPQLGRKKIRFTKELEGNLPKIRVDANQIMDVLVNIILNAIQAVGTKGEIDVVSGKEFVKTKIKDLSYSPFENSNSTKKIMINQGVQVIKIAISDNGDGISEEKIKSIFDPFFTTKLNGTGLGLTIAKRIINDHGGVIRLEEYHNGNTTFTIFFPVGDQV